MSYLSSVFSMIASGKHDSSGAFYKPKLLLFNKSSTDIFTIRVLKIKTYLRLKSVNVYLR